MITSSNIKKTIRVLNSISFCIKQLSLLSGQALIDQAAFLTAKLCCLKKYYFEEETIVYRINRLKRSICFALSAQTIPVIDASATLFISTANITDPTEQSSLQTLVINAKANGWWVLSDGIYPFVGGTSISQAVNLKTPGTFDLLFRGFAVHSAMGYQTTSATGQHASTQYSMTNAPAFDEHISYYSRTAAQEVNTDMGASGIANSTIDLYVAYTDSKLYAGMNDYPNYPLTVTNVSGAGWFLLTRVSNIDARVFKNNTQLGISVAPALNANCANHVYINGRNGGNNLISDFNNGRQCAFATVGRGISPAIAALMYADIQAFQTSLGRNV